MATQDRGENRLGGESSPYLQLHRHNPVDWFPWAEEALERARREDLPIFLSVGYSTCYWCHVMERESFSDPEIAERLNRGFVSIKVDREERPELDEIYMAATQVLTGQGGWPNSVFLTPALEPFFAGTYFPPTGRFGRPGFDSVLDGVARAWRERRNEVEAQAQRISAAMRRILEMPSKPSGEPASPEVAGRALASLDRTFDPRWGGFGGAPKFPTPSGLFLLLELAPEEPRALEMLTVTLDRMARGGIYDQIAGGFHRYATDVEWRVPHFEKMLYDNGLLLEVYAKAWAVTGDPELARVVRETAAFLERELTAPEGALWSAIDAETDGMEGAYYVWTRQQLEEVLGCEDAIFLAPLFGFHLPPFFEGQHYVLHLPSSIPELARERQMDTSQLLSRLASLKRRLLEARFDRRRPLTDDKILADWNGLAIAGLAASGRLLEEPDLVRQARSAASFVLDSMRPEGSCLFHSWRQGVGKVKAFLADYAFLVHGLLELAEASGEGRWVEAATDLAQEQEDRLADPRGGYYAAASSDDLLCRSKDVFDGALPSANAVTVLNLLHLFELSGERPWLEAAESCLRAFVPLVDAQPAGSRMMALATRRYHAVAVRRAARGAPEAVAARPAAASTSLVSPRLTVAGAQEGGWREFRIELAIASGWHLNANPASLGFLVPTEVRGEGVQLRDLVYPAGELLESGSGGPALAAYRGEVAVTGKLRPRQEEDGALVVICQPCCEDRCLEPLELNLPLGELLD